MDDGQDRRRRLAEWITAKDNPFFARNIVNRVWGYLMGRGLFEPLDDLRETNPACAPELLDALARDFVASGYDLKHVLRTVMQSRAYQLDSTESSGNSADKANAFFARYQTKRLAAEQLADAIDYATESRQKYPGLPLGTRAIQLPDPRVSSYLLDVSGRPQRVVTCECERTSQPNIALALHFLNGDTLNKKIADSNGRVERLSKSKAPADAMIAEMYLVTLSRPPRPDEVSRAKRWLANAGSLREGMQDLLWALLNSREFLFNH